MRDFITVSLNGQCFVLMHYPMLSWPKKNSGSIQLHGHIHSDAHYNNRNRDEGNIIEPYHIYEIGYPRCVCQQAQSEKEADPNFCECSRQSILYVYENLIPDKKVTVETIETALTGGSKCRFRVIVE